LFQKQDDDYREEILPARVRARVSVEAGRAMGWERWVGDEGDIIGIHDRFGASAPGPVVMQNFGFTAENVAARVAAVVERVNGVRA
jgi:transketolase